METESNPADMLTKALVRSKVDEFCAETGQTEPHAKTVDKKPKEVKKLKTVKFAVETMRTSDETIKNKFKDSSIATIKNKLKDSGVAKIENESKDAQLRWMHTVD